MRRRSVSLSTRAVSRSRDQLGPIGGQRDLLDQRLGEQALLVGQTPRRTAESAGRPRRGTRARPSSARTTRRSRTACRCSGRLAGRDRSPSRRRRDRWGRRPTLCGMLRRDPQSAQIAALAAQHDRLAARAPPPAPRNRPEAPAPRRPRRRGWRPAPGARGRASLAARSSTTWRRKRAASWLQTTAATRKASAATSSSPLVMLKREARLGEEEVVGEKAEDGGVQRDADGCERTATAITARDEDERQAGDRQDAVERRRHRGRDHRHHGGDAVLRGPSRPRRLALAQPARAQARRPAC